METKYGVQLKLEEIGNVGAEGSNNLRNLKSKARKAFKLAVVKSVCIFDGFGNSLFYLKRLENGSTYKEEIIGIPAGRIQVRAK